MRHEGIDIEVTTDNGDKFIAKAQIRDANGKVYGFSAVAISRDLAIEEVKRLIDESLNRA